tara:strand:- start:617 stop:1864 length:1248 start_codon:yes stop_codon:yes gene_type:complete
VISSKKINKCRLCRSNKLKTIVKFGDLPLGNDLRKTKKSSKNAEEYPLNLMQCKLCNHFQINFSVSPKKLYATNYTYLSSVSNSFIKHFEDYSKWVTKKCRLKKGQLILDIGSNDGACLNEFKKLDLSVLGIDPAQIPSQVANKKGIKTINKFFDDKACTFIKNNYGSIDFITSHNVLAHIDDLEGVFTNIYSLLKKNGFFCFEVGYFVEVLKNNYFDTIYHEHLDYHHALPLVKFLNKVGFSVVNISTNKIQGGSIRILCKKLTNIKVYSQPKNFLIKESKFMKTKKNFLKKWGIEISKNMMSFEKLIKKYSIEKKKILGYGAPTKATLILKISDLRTGIISNIIEDNKLKVGRYMPQTNIRITEYNVKNIENADIIIVFAWNFFSDIINKLKKDNIKNKTIIVPLPKVKKYKI